MDKKSEEAEEKRRFTLWIKSSTMDEAKNLMKVADCKSTSEFIAKAMEFYCGYLRNSTDDYVPEIVLATLKGVMNETENRHNGSLFRIAVELSMIKNILALREGISDVALNKLRGDCVSEVKKINGTISYEDAIRWQT